MRSRLTLMILLVFALFLGVTATALGAPVITAHGRTNSIDWNSASLKTARVYAKTDVSGAWAIIEILSSKGVVRRLYSGPAAAAGTMLWTLPWNGTDAGGKYLPTGNYVYRTQISKGGQIAWARGVIRVYTGPVMVTVPDVTRMYFLDAEAALKRLGFGVVLKWIYMGDPNAHGAGHGYIDQQSPVGGSSRPKGSSVTIWVAYETS